MESLVSYFAEPAAAFVRGRYLQMRDFDLAEHLAEKPLTALSSDELSRIIQTGREAGLRLHHFKRTMELPRVRQVLGILKGIQPANLLDIGSGRGVFLWPLLDAFPALPVTAVDKDEQRVRQIQAVQRGGIDRLSCWHMDATHLEFDDDHGSGRHCFDVVTMLEVLEHIPEARSALAEAVRVAGRFVIVSVPLRRDDNPEHIHLFSQATLRRMFEDSGVQRVNFDYVLNHMIAVASVEKTEK